MPANTVQEQFAAPPDAAWALVGDFDGIDKVFSAITDVEIADGTRTFSMMGMRITERLIARDDDARSITYGIVEGVDIGSHEATITVREADAGCEIEWSVTTVPEEAQPLFADTYSRALAQLHPVLDQR